MKTNSLNTSLAFVRIVYTKLSLKNDRILEGQVNGSMVGVMMTELPKAFDSLNHNFLFEKTGGIWFR